MYSTSCPMTAGTDSSIPVTLDEVKLFSKMNGSMNEGRQVIMHSDSNFKNISVSLAVLFFSLSVLTAKTAIFFFM